MKRRIDLTGKRFGRWSVLQFAHSDIHGSHWKCRCACGKEKVVQCYAMTSGRSTSCGCAIRRRTGAANNRFKHGCTYSPEWIAWNGMRARCFNPNNHKYPSYGGRGITVCERWRDSFENFFADMGSKPKGFTLGRIDNDGPYSPENCRWENVSQQANNKRTSRVIDLNGEQKTLAQWCLHLGLNMKSVFSRLTYGWTEREALTIPFLAGKRAVPTVRIARKQRSKVR